MTAFTKTTPGHPGQGFYSLGDTITDSNNVVWTCVKGGFAIAAGSFGAANTAQFVAQPVASSIAPGVVSSNSGTCTAVERGLPNGVRQTVITLAALSQVIVNGASEWVGTKIFTFPEGRILLLGATATIAPTTTSTLATTITSATGGTFALGSVTNDGTLTTTKADMLPSGSFTSSTVINVAAAAATNKLAASAQFDGTATAIAAFLNTNVATNSADGTLTWAGTITLTWAFLGDY